jgi:hypothetical protein
VDAGLGRLHGIVLVVDRAGRAGEVVDLVHLDVEREGHVVTNQLEQRVAHQVGDVALGAGEEIVDAEHVMAISQQSIAQVRAQEAGAAGNENLLHGASFNHSEVRNLAWATGWHEIDSPYPFRSSSLPASDRFRKVFEGVDDRRLGIGVESARSRRSTWTTSLPQGTGRHLRRPRPARRRPVLRQTI